MKHSRVEKPPPPCGFLMYHRLQIRCRFGSLKTGTSLHQHAGMGGAGGVIGVEDQWKPTNRKKNSRFLAFWVLSVKDPYLWVVQILGENFSWLSCGRNKDVWRKEMKSTFEMMLETCKLCCWLLDLWTHAHLKWCDSCKPLRNKMKNKKLRSMPFRHNFCSVYEGFGWMLAFQTDMLSICIQAIKLCETASEKEETMRQLDFLVICWSAGLFVWFNVSHATKRVLSSKSISRFWRWRYWHLQEKAFALSPPWPAPFIAVPGCDGRAEHGGMGTGDVGDELTVVEGTNQGVTRSRKTWSRRRTTTNGQIMWKPKVTKNFQSHMRTSKLHEDTLVLDSSCDLKLSLKDWKKPTN